MASQAVARMQPLVTHPAMMQVSTEAAVRIDASGVPKNELWNFFTRSGSRGSGASRASTSTAGVPRICCRSPGAFLMKSPASRRCGS